MGWGVSHAVVTSTGTVHLPELIDWRAGEAVTVCGVEGELVELDPRPDPDGVCKRCLSGHEHPGAFIRGDLDELDDEGDE